MLLFLFLLSLTGIFIFAGSETGFVSWNRLKISFRAGRGDPLARSALFLIDHKEALLSAILIGSNVSVVSATILFIALFTRLDAQVSLVNLQTLPSPESWILAPIVLIFCEMIPKSLFRIYSFSFTMRMVPLLIITYYFFRPCTWIFDLVKRLLAPRVSDEASFNIKVREEMVTLAWEGSKTGGIFDHANTLIRNVLALKGKTVRDAMIPLQDIGSVSTVKAAETVSQALQRQQERPDDEMLVLADNGKSVLGIVSIKEMFNVAGEKTIESIMKPLRSVLIDRALLAGFEQAIDCSQWYYGVTDAQGALCGVLPTRVVSGMFFKGF